MKEKWEKTSLGEIAFVKSGGTPARSKKEYWKGNIAWYSSGELNDLTTKEPERYINELAIDNSSAKLFPKGSLLIGMYDTAALKMSILDRNAAFNQAIAGVKPNEKIDLKFILYSINSIKSEILNLRRGVRQKNLNLTKIKNIPIFLPPLFEQQRIAATLDKAFTAIDKAKANTEQNLKNAKELFESYLQGVFENKNDWEEKALEEVANIKGRIGWKGLTAKEYKEEGPLFLSVHSLNYGDYIDFRDAFHISQARYNESPEIMLKKNDILICKDGAGIGKLGIVPTLPDKATINSSLLLIRCKKVILTKFLYFNLLSPLFQNIVQSRLMGATTPHLYQRDIKTFPVLLPKLDEQKIIVKKLDALSSKIKRLENIYQKKLDNLEELKKSILQKAFNGELNTEKELEL